MIQFSDKNRENSKFNSYLILNNIMQSGNFSIIDLKFKLTEENTNYKKLDNPEKLTSNKNKNYLNFQGLRFVNEKHEQYFYSKNLEKYRDLGSQKLMIRKFFTQMRNNYELDKKAIGLLRNQINELKSIFEGYGLSLRTSSILVLYDALSKEIKLKFVDFSYMSQPIFETAYVGLELFMNLLDQLIK